MARLAGALPYALVLLLTMNKVGRDSHPAKRICRGTRGRPPAAIFLLALLLALVPSMSVASQRAAGAPQLVLDSSRHDFEEVFAGEDLSHVFWVRNIGSAPLELSEMPQLGTRPSKVSIHQPLNQPKNNALAKMGRAAPS